MQLTPNLVQEITGETPVGSSRFDDVALSWTWDVSPDDTQDIVMTMNPGGTQTVTLSSNTQQFLGSSGKVRNEPCGTVFPDTFQGTPVYDEGGTPIIFPGSVPVSDYCFYQGPDDSGHTEGSYSQGDTWENDWAYIMQTGLGAVDAVCRCALGRVGAMLEMSGVFFSNPLFTQDLITDTGIKESGSGSGKLQDRQAVIYNAYKWMETPQYIAPMIFYCRDDYVLYWNLVLAYDSVYNTNSMTHAIWETAHGYAFGTQDAAYWRRFYLLGVDCQKAITTLPTATNNPCQGEGNSTIRFLPDVVVGLDIGQLLWALDIRAWCGAATEADIELSCAKDYLWQFATLKRRGIGNGCVINGEIDPRICVDNTLLDNRAGVSANSDYILSIPTNGSALTWPAYSTPSTGWHDFALETTALFVRIVAYSDISTWNETVFATDYPIPSPRGSECTPSMVEGEKRIGPDAVNANVTSGVSGTSVASMASKGCPGSYPVRGGITYQNQAGTITGYCVTGDGPVDGYTCNNLEAVADGTPCGIDYTSQIRADLQNNPKEIFLGWKPCGATNEQVNGQACGTKFGPQWKFYCALLLQIYGGQAGVTDVSCYSGPGSTYGDHDTCVVIAQTCGTGLRYAIEIVNWVGGTYIPVLGFPRLRGMMPTSFYTEDDACSCTSTTSMCFASIQFNKCTAYMPRPPVSSIFARGFSPTKLDYRAVFLDPMMETYFGESGSPRFYTSAEAGQFDGTTALYGNASKYGYGGPDYAILFCETNVDASFCLGKEAGFQYSTHMLTQSEYTEYMGTGDTNGSFTYLLTRYYSTLNNRASTNVGDWYDVYFYLTDASLWDTRVGRVRYVGGVTGFTSTIGNGYYFGSSVDLCFYVGWCFKSYTGVTIHNGTTNTPVDPLYSFASTLQTLPPFQPAESARSTYFGGTGLGCTGSYCLGSTAAWRGDATVPFYLWNRWRPSGTVYGWGEIKPLLQQVVTWDTSYIVGFSTQFTDEWRMFGATDGGLLLGSDSIRVRAKWCWVSARGHVHDTQSALLGTCMTPNVCYHKFYLGNSMVSEMGCLDTWDSTGWTQVQVTNNIIHWDTELVTANDTIECWTNTNMRMCTMVPGYTTTPPMLTTENIIDMGTPTNSVNSTQSVYDTVSRACGCSNTIASTVPWPTWVCRSNVDGQCYLDPTGDCEANDFNCGTQFGYDVSMSDATSFLHLCKGCGDLGDKLSVGQCMGDVCVGLLKNGSCPWGTTLCASTYASGVFPGAIDANVSVGSFIEAVNSLGGPLFFIWNNGTHTADLFGVQTYTFPIQRWMPSTLPTDHSLGPNPSLTFDGVHCVGVYNPTKTLAILESPAYLRGDTAATERFPAGLTEDALQAWCGYGTDCSSPTSIRRWLCIDAGQSIDTFTQQCALRRSWVDSYNTYEDDNGATSGYYGSPTSHEVFPDCQSWVSGLDPDSWCQRDDAFTGCVISRVNVHSASMSTDNQGEQFEGVVPNDWTELGVISAFTSEACQASCNANASCVAWHYRTACTLYSSGGSWEMDAGIASESAYDIVGDTVGTLFPITGGFLVPRVQAGPVLEQNIPLVASAYLVTGIDLFIMDPNGPTALYTPDTTVSCSGELLYYGVVDESTVTGVKSASITGCSVLTNVSIYESTLHKFASTPLIVRVNVSTALVIGLLSESTNGFQTSFYSQGVTGDTSIGNGRGLRGVLRKDGGPFQITYTNRTGSYTTYGTTAGWVYDPLYYRRVVVSSDVVRTQKRACVPIAMRQVVDYNTMPAQANVLNIFRRDPVDCVVAGAVSGDPEVQNVIYGQDGLCYGDQLLQWPSLEVSNNVAKVTNLNYFSWWTWAMPGLPAPIFFDYNAPTTTDVNGLGVVGGVRPINAVPNCGDDTAACVLAYDLVGYTPCTGELHTTWFTCMKPPMVALFPLYESDFSVEQSTPFFYPDNLFVTEDVNALDVNSSWTLYYWSQYMTMVHYCDRYSYTPGDPDQSDDNLIGWKKGRFVACDNDPMDNSQRLSFCRTQQPWWVITGKIFTTFSFSDLCPFVVANVDQYCFVFSDHPQYPTIAALLSAQLPDGLTWDDTTFYYMPMKMSVLSYLLFQPHVVNTLITNNLFTTGVELTSDNYLDYGPSAQQYYKPFLVLTDAEYSLVNGIVNDTLVPEMFIALYKVIQAHYNAGTNTYTFGLTASSTSATVTLAPGDVIPVFNEANALIDYNGVTIRGLVDGVAAVLGNAVNTVVNQIKICTRLQLDGVDITVTNIIFNQTLCTLTDVSLQTPIIFSGSLARNAIIYNITVIDTDTAIAVLGADSLVYTYSPVIDGDGILIYDILFQYTANSIIPVVDRRTVAMFALMTGVPSVWYCYLPVPPGFTRMANCFLNTTLTPTTRTCIMPDQCLETTECCGRLSTHSQTIENFDCEYGVMCVGNVTQINQWYIYQPNAQVICNHIWTGCVTGVSECVSPTNCYYERTNCKVLVAGDMKLEPSVDITQEWQYYSPGLWYAVYPPYYSARYSGSVDFVDGIGYANYVWTVRGSTTSVSDLYLHATEIPVVAGVNDTLDTITVIPRYRTRVDGVPQDITELVLMTDWFFHAADRSSLSASFLTSLLDTNWCVGVEIATGQLRMAVCGNSSFYTEWYMNPGTNTFHVYGYPHMCVTRLNDTALRWLPCTACNVGDTSTTYNTFTTATQLFLTNGSAVVPGTLVDVTLPSVAWTFRSGASDVAFLLNENFECLTYPGMGWSACDPNKMFPSNTPLCHESTTPFLVGIFRYVCTQGYGGTITDAVALDPSCVFSTTTVLGGDGLGASLTLNVDGSVSVNHGGDGYRNGETVYAGSCPVNVFTATVLVQPSTTNFSISTAGVQVINYTEVTGIMGSTYVAQMYTKPTSFRIVYDTLVVGLIALNAIVWILVAISCMLRYRKKKSKRE